MAPETLQRLQEVLAAHRTLGIPEEAGSTIARPPLAGA
jgi:hypothetical protein